MRAELNLLKLEGNESCAAPPLTEIGVKSMTGEFVPGEKRIFNVEGASGGDGESEGDEAMLAGTSTVSWLELKEMSPGRSCGVGRRGRGGGGGPTGNDLEAGQHQELWEETTVGGSSFRPAA